MKKRIQKKHAEILTRIFDSIINGRPYPKMLLYSMVQVCIRDQDVIEKDKVSNKKYKYSAITRNRAGIIKGCLTRDKYIERGEYDMLNENSTNTAYNFGRLFAILEKLQEKAVEDINTTVKDRHFSSACATPLLAYPRLLTLAQHHLSKLKKDEKTIKYANFTDKQIGKIVDMIDGETFPKVFNMEQQGTFIIGYYQQKQKLYEGKNAVEQVNSKNSEEEN